MYRCIIIDDEPQAIEGLKKYIESTPNLMIVASYTDPYTALTELDKIDNIDLVLLDIDMPALTGIELSKSIKNKVRHIVFTTGHTKYGYEAYQVEASAYLLKPYTLGEFMITINKLFPHSNTLKTEVERSVFLVKNKDDDNRIVTVRFDEVIAVESKLNYITIYTRDKNVTTYLSLTEMFDILSQKEGFLQFHRSFIISYFHIQYIEGNLIKMNNGLKITVREYYKKKFSAFINKNIIRTKSKTTGKFE